MEWVSWLLLQSWFHVLMLNNGCTYAGSAGTGVRLWCPQAALQSWQEQLQASEPSPQHFSLRVIYICMVIWGAEEN